MHFWHKRDVCTETHWTSGLTVTAVNHFEAARELHDYTTKETSYDNVWGALLCEGRAVMGEQRVFPRKKGGIESERTAQHTLDPHVNGLQVG